MTSFVNIFERLRGLVPQPDLYVGEVIEIHDDDTSTVEIPGPPVTGVAGNVSVGSLLRPRGTSVPVGKRAFVRAGVIETQAPEGDIVDIEVGTIVLPPPPDVTPPPPPPAPSPPVAFVRYTALEDGTTVSFPATIGDTTEIFYTTLAGGSVGVVYYAFASSTPGTFNVSAGVVSGSGLSEGATRTFAVAGFSTLHSFDRVIMAVNSGGGDYIVTSGSVLIEFLDEDENVLLSGTVDASSPTGYYFPS